MKTIQQKLSNYALQILLLGTTLSFISTWLPFIRSIFDGESYMWGKGFLNFKFTGNGLNGDFFYLIIDVTIGLFLIYSIFFNRKRWQMYLSAIIWFGSILINVIYRVIYEGGYPFHGDTIGLRINLEKVLIPFLTLMFFLIFFLIYKKEESITKAQWSSTNKKLLIIGLSLLPIQFLLFSTGDPHGTTDIIGVIISVLQVLFLNFIFKYYRQSDLLVESTVDFLPFTSQDN